MGDLFDAKQLIGLNSHVVHFIRGAVSLESNFPLCLDDFMVTLSDSLVAIPSSLQLDLIPEGVPSNAAGGLDFLLESLLHQCLNK